MLRFLLKHLSTKLRSSGRTAEHDYWNVFLKARRHVYSTCEGELNRPRVLVIGCGYTYPDPLLWSSEAECAVGVDVRKAFWRSGYVPLIAEYRARGLNVASAFSRSIVQRVSLLRFYNRLREVSGREFHELNQDLVVYDGKNLPFADSSFDIILSNAVLEHVSDLEPLAEEMARVTKAGGVCYHLWHNYYSLSGAHVPDDLVAACPWGHLRGDVNVRDWLLMSGTYLNKRLPNEITQVLSKQFDEIATHRLDKSHNVSGQDVSYISEGEQLLTSEIATSLGSYPRVVLLTRSYAFLGKRRNPLFTPPE